MIEKQDTEALARELYDAARNIELARNSGITEHLAGWEHRICRQAANALRSQPVGEWPADAKFFYGDPVHVAPAFDGGASFSGHVVGWHRPNHMRFLGYAIQHEHHKHIHVEPEKRLNHGLLPTPPAQGDDHDQ